MDPEQFLHNYGAGLTQTAASMSGAMQGMAFSLYRQMNDVPEPPAEEPPSPCLIKFDDEEVCHSPLARAITPRQKASADSPFNPRAPTGLNVPLQPLSGN